MKRIYLTVAVLLQTAVSLAQDTISIQSLPQAGWTYVVSNDSTTHYVIPNASTVAQNWDYSNLQEDYPKVPTYDSTVFTAYAGTFPTSNLYTYGPAALYSGLFGSAPVGSQGFNKGYMFWKADSTGFWTEGFRPDNGLNGTSGETHVQPHELLIPLPGILGAEYPDSSSWSLEFNQNQADVDTLYVTSTVKHFKYDAFGTMKTPYGYFPNVLRVHEYSVKVDSVFASMNGMSVYEMEFSRDTTHTYFYLDKNTEYPVLTMYADAQNLIKFTEYRRMRIPSTMTTSINVMPASCEIKVYPNPFQERVTIETDIENSKFVLLMLNGSIIKEENLYKGKNSFDVNLLSAGVYFYRIQSSDGALLFVGKLVKK